MKNPKDRCLSTYQKLAPTRALTNLSGYIQFDQPASPIARRLVRTFPQTSAISYTLIAAHPMWDANAGLILVNHRWLERPGAT